MISFFQAEQTTNIISFILEYFVILFFFKSIKRAEARWRLVGYIVLILLGFLYFFHDADIFSGRYMHNAANFMLQFLRMIFRWVVILAYLMISKEIPFKIALYYSGLSMCLYLTCQNIRIAFRQGIRLMGGSVGTLNLMTYAAIAVEWLIAIFICRWMDLKKVKTDKIRWTIIIVTILLETYFKWSLLSLPQTVTADGQWTDTLVYGVVASLAILLVQVIFEINQQNQEEKKSSELQRVSLSYEMQNAKRSIQANSDIKRLYHDMKNHLTAIKSMIEDNQAVDTYLEDLIPRLESYDSQISTGNQTVDAVLGEKIQRAYLDNIQFNIYMDLSNQSYISPVDLVTIFGNTIDNAVEAVRKLGEGIEKIIYIKSTKMANYTAIKISNQYTGEITLDKGMPQTNKEDKDYHGIGLSSVLAAVSRYSGTMEIKIDDKNNWFQIIILLPDQS